MVTDEFDDDPTRSFTYLAADAEFSHYRVISRIGAGGMGEVYLAEDTRLDRKVALKFLSPHLSLDESARARFTREAKAAAKLDHPNIVQVFETGEHAGRPFLAMAYVEGKPLREVIKNNNLSIHDCVELTKQISDGLHRAHQSGIVHRDMKPDNVIIDSDGKPRILDFGLATVVGEEKLTRTGSTLGTMGYMSPEQIEGKQVDLRSDIFSVGVIMYEMLTGKRPFMGETEAAVSQSIITSTPEPIARYKTGTTAHLQQIVDKALAKDPKHRYQHLDELVTDLRRLSLPGSGHTSFTRRNRRLLLAVAGLVCLGAVLFVTKFWKKTGEPADVSEASSTRIAIVPFSNQTGDTTFNAWGRLVSDWTSQSLVQTGLAEVVSSDVLTGLGESARVKSIAEATGAGILVTGSYYRLADRIQFQAQIVKADEELIHAVEPVSCLPDEMDKAVDSLRQRILGGLALVLNKKLSGTIIGESSPPTYEAYQEFVMAFDAFHLRFDWLGAIEHYRRAYEKDTLFLEPLIESCPAYFNAGRRGEADSLLQFLNERRSRLNLPQQLAVDLFTNEFAGNMTEALDACRKLAALLPGSHASFQVGFLAVHMNLPREAIAAFKTVNPDAGWAQSWPLYWTNYSFAYHLLGDFKKELALAREGRRRFPNNSVNYDAEIKALAALGEVDELRKVIDEFAILHDAGTITNWSRGSAERTAAIELRAHGFKEESTEMFNEAVDSFKRQATSQSSDPRPILSLVLLEAGRWSEAGDLCQQLENGSSRGMRVRATCGIIAAHDGDSTGAMEVFDWLKNLKWPYLYGENLYECARISAVKGDKKEALALLKQAIAQGYSEFDVHADFAFESMRDYPPFVEFLKPKG